MPEPTWVVVCGGIHLLGGMDKSNAHLVRRLLEADRTVHVVAHEVDPRIAEAPGVRVHEVPRPWGSFALGARHLDRIGRAVARRVLQREPTARVLSNGAACRQPGANWVHCVHAAWAACDAGAPASFRLRNRWTKWRGRALERAALQCATLIVTNSRRTQREVVALPGISAERVHVIELGSDAEAAPTTSTEGRARRRELGLPPDVPVVLFAGALGWDANKGFDTLFAAWSALCDDPAWTPQLLVVGDGSARGHWEQRAARTRWADRVRFLGRRDDLPRILAASDLLVAPSRYEAYGLTAREALTRDVPVLVTRSAGVAEHLGDCPRALLDDPNDAAELVRRLRDWRADREAWHAAIAPIAVRLRRHTWTQMADDLIARVEATTGGAEWDSETLRIRSNLGERLSA